MIWIRYWREILIAVLLVSSAGSLYSVVYNRGVTSVEEQYAQKIEEHNRRVLDQVLKVQDLSSELAKSNRTQAALVSRDLKDIITRLDRKPLFQINQKGVCTPSPEFYDAYNQIIKRANQ